MRVDWINAELHDSEDTTAGYRLYKASTDTEVQNHSKIKRKQGFSCSFAHNTLLEENILYGILKGSYRTLEVPIMGSVYLILIN